MFWQGPEGRSFLSCSSLQRKKNEAPGEVWGDEGREMVPSLCRVASPGPFYSLGTVDKMSRVLEFSESINREKKHIIGSKIEIPQNKISD